MRGFLSMRHVSKSFGGERVIDDLSMDLRRGEILAILGPSGCGKSTTLRIVSGLIRQDRGRILLNGERMDRVPVHRRGMGFVFQNYSLFPHLNVGGNVEFGMRMKGTSPRAMRKRVRELLELVGMEGFEGRRPSQLSGGQQQRVALARALAVDPVILLLDEPFGALDAKIRKRIRRDLKGLQEELGISMLFVTHDQEEAFEVGDRIAVMNGGRFEQVGLPRDLYEDPATGFVAKFVGSMNVIVLPGKDGRPASEVMVRPEDVRLYRDHDRNDLKGVKGTLVSYVYLGHYIEVRVLLGNGEYLTSVMPKSEFLGKGLRRGQILRVRIMKIRSF